MSTTNADDEDMDGEDDWSINDVGHYRRNDSTDPFLEWHQTKRIRVNGTERSAVVLLPGEIWGSTVVVKNHSSNTTVGYGSNFTGSTSSSAQFTHSSTTYTVQQVYNTASPGSVSIVLSPHPAATDVSDLSLRIGDEVLLFSAATRGSTTFTWTDSSKWNSADTPFSDAASISMKIAKNAAATGKPTVLVPHVHRVPAVLSADVGLINDTNGLGGVDFTYQWIRVENMTDTNIGIDSATYTLTAADVGKKIKLKVNFTDNAGFAEERTSDAVPGSTETIQAAATCNAPTYPSGKVQLWTGRVTIGQYTSGGATFIGFSNAASEGIGSLDNKTFSVGGNNYEITRIRTFTTSGGLNLHLSLKSDLSTADKGALNLYVCDRNVELNDATIYRDSRISLVEYRWGPLNGTTTTNGIDFSSHAERTVYLSGNDTAPTFASATVNGTSLVLTFNENLGAATNLANSGFAVQVGGSPVTLSSSDAPVISGTTVTLTLATAVAVGATVTVSYTKPTTGSNNKLVDTANNEVATFADQPVTNNTASQPNTTPTASDGTVTTTEDTAYTFFASDFNYTDADRDPLASVRIVTLPALGTLKLNNTNVTAGNAVTTTRLDNGHLTYTPPANAHGTPYTTFTFTVNDGTDDSTSPATMTINVTPMANSPATGAPTITGTAQVGQTLTAVTTAIMDADGLTSVVYTYQWIRVATDTTEMNIARATASTYTLVEADQGTTIKVTVRFTDDASNPETRTSTATMAVAAAPKVLLDLSPPSISETGTEITRVTASLDKPSSAPTTVTVMAPAGDVTLGGRTMTIPANSLQVAGTLVTLTAVDNDIHGPARKIVQVSGTTNNPLVADPDPVDLEIVDDDGAPTVELVLTPQQISEPGGVSTVTARLMNGSGLSSEVTRVVVSAAAVSPAVAGDFELSMNPTLTIAAGATASTGVVTLTALDNDIDAPNKQVTVSGTATNDYGIAGNPASQPLLITDDEGPPRVTLTLLPDAIIKESDALDNSVTVMVTLSHPSSEETTVTVTADPPEAVTPISPMLTILAGFREGSVSLTAVDNDIDGPETQTVAVSAVATNALGVTNPTDALPLTITDDDAPPVVTLMLSETSIDEHSGQSTVTATLDRASSQQIVVTVARDPAYTLSPNTSLTFPAGETASQGTVTLTATDNDIDAEDAVVSVGGTTNPSGLTVNAAMLTIRDDDTRVVMVSKDTLSIREHNEGKPRPGTPIRWCWSPSRPPPWRLRLPCWRPMKRRSS